jgi:hypothetical protein
MRITIEHIEIPLEKINGYLLVPKDNNDKSAFLANLGYTIANSDELINDIKQLVVINDVHLQQKSVFGDMYAVKGKLRNFAVVTIWLLAIDSVNYRFITLFPDK